MENKYNLASLLTRKNEQPFKLSLKETITIPETPTDMNAHEESIESLVDTNNNPIDMNMV